MRRFAALQASPVPNFARAFSFQPRLRDYYFLLEDVFGMYTHYEELGKPQDRALVGSLLEEAAKLTSNVVFPPLDWEGCRLEPDGSVATPSGFRECYKALVDGGWCGVSSPEEYGGRGLPSSISFIVREMLATANWPIATISSLSAGAAQTLQACCSEEQRRLFLPPLIQGRWSGTMCLTEPQCGSDLGQCTARAEPAADGRYRITGTKISIFAGDHDITENILHLVLARLPDAPSGTKGLSLFLVPKFLPEPTADGATALGGQRNVTCIALEDKMGMNGCSACQMLFDGSVGFLIGEPHAGIKEILTFMNATRIGTATQGVALAELAFQNALEYARGRRSIRSLADPQFPEAMADPIGVHSNVRHNILFCKAVAEGGRAFIMDAMRLLDKIDAAAAAGDTAHHRALDSQLGLLTPIAKGFLTELCFEAAVRAQQVFGGHGCIKANGMEQIVRGARIATLYEGTTGTQALDLLGRKVMLAEDTTVSDLMKSISSLCRSNMFGRGAISGMARQLWVLEKSQKLLIMRLKVGAMSNKEIIGAASEEFLMASGYLMLGYYWLRMAISAQQQVLANKDPDGFYKTKLETAQFYFSRVLPRFHAHLQVAQEPAEGLHTIPADKILVE